MPGTIKFYTDEHIASAVILGLRRHGVDVLSVPNAGTMGATDDQHFALAQTQRRVIVTNDKGFLAIAAKNPNHAGLAFAARPLSIGTIIAGLLLIHQVYEPADMIGRVEYL